MDEDGHPRALKPERRRHENDCNTGLASKAHRFLSLLFARAAPPFFEKHPMFQSSTSTPPKGRFSWLSSVSETPQQKWRRVSCQVPDCCHGYTNFLITLSADRLNNYLSLRDLVYPFCVRP